MHSELSRPARHLVALALLLATLGAKTAQTEHSPGEAPRAKPPKLKHGVFRFTSYPVAWTAAQKSQRPILIFVSSPSCPHCTHMLAKTYRAQGVKKIVGDRFETVYVDRARQPRLTEKLKVRWYPTTLVVGPDNKVMDVIEGYVDSAAFTRRLAASLASLEPAGESASIALTARASP